MDVSHSSVLYEYPPQILSPSSFGYQNLEKFSIVNRHVTYLVHAHGKTCSSRKIYCTKILFYFNLVSNYDFSIFLVLYPLVMSTRILFALFFQQHS